MAVYFYAVKLTLDRGGEPDLYLSDEFDLLLTKYRREGLERATRFPEHAREQAEVFFDACSRYDLHVELVRLRAVAGEPGDWRGWYRSEGEDRYTIHGPGGEEITCDRGQPRPYTAAGLNDARNRPRRFTTADAARKALRTVAAAQ